MEERFKQLELVNCNTNSQISFLIQKINKRKDIENNINNPCFDLYRKRGETVKFNNYKYEAINHAYQCLLLCETAGLPLSVQNFSIGSSLINTLIENYDLIDKKIAQRIVVRLKPTDDNSFINNLYSRVSIASLSNNEFEKLLSQIENLLEYCLNIFNKNPSLFWISYIRTSLELISRLIVRLNKNQSIEHHLVKSIQLFKDLSLRKVLWLQRPLSNYLKRCWEASTPDIKRLYIFKILQLPLNGLNINDEQLITPNNILSMQDIGKLCTRNSTNEEEWNNILNLILSGLKLSKKPRWDACLRLTLISNFINQNEQIIINELLWNETSRSNNDFPLDTNLYDFAYILYPNELGFKASEVFFKKYFILSNDFKFLTRSFIEISNVIDMINLDVNHKKVLISNIKNWIESISEYEIKIDSFQRAFNSIDNEIIDTFSKLNEIILKINIPNDLADLLFGKMQFLIGFGIYSYHLVGTLTKALPNRIQDINTYLRKGIISDLPENSRHAMYGLYLWIQKTINNSQLDIPYPSDDLIREVGLSIAMRRKNNVIQALLIAISIFKSNNDNAKKIISELVLEGLEYLILEQNYETVKDGIDDTPIIRLNCFKLAYQMSLIGYQNEPLIQKWIMQGKSDPLPEVRNSIIDLEPDTTL